MSYAWVMINKHSLMHLIIEAINYQDSKCNIAEFFVRPF